ncbi:MAG: PadR family transcriptional regulator [Deferribacterales bacterium]
MQREAELAFIKLHILHHAAKEEVYGAGLMEELARHGYRIGAGVMYPALAKMEKQSLISCRTENVGGKQRKYYRITENGRDLLAEMKLKIEELHEELNED